MGEGAGMGRRGRRRILGLALALACLGLAGCGLETVSYYGDPGFYYSGNVLTVTHNTSNNDGNFLGYDIYYRAYPSSTTADTARAAIESAISSTSATPESVISQMKSAGFVKMYLGSSPTSAPTPLIKVASGDLSSAVKYNFTFLNSSSSTNWYYAASSDSSTQYEVVRGLGLKSYNSFNYPYQIGDTDYSSSNVAVSSKGTVYLVFFAVAYGYDISKLSSTYSFPAALYETISYSLP